MSDGTLHNDSVSRLVGVLARLASLTIQEHYIIHGTQESYVTPDDLLEDFHSSMLFFRFARSPERLKKLKKTIGHTAYRELLELERLIEQNPSFLESYTHETLGLLIHSDPVWVKIRNTASDVLKGMSFDLERWEKDNA